MDREIDCACDQGQIELLGEKPLAARLLQRAVLDLIAGGLDDHDLDRLRRNTMCLGEAALNHIGLGQSQGAAAGAEFQLEGCRRRSVHLNG